MGTERRSLIKFVIGAALLVAAAFWFSRWLAEGGPSRSTLKPGQIVFISDRLGTWDLWIMNSDGSDSRRLLAQKGDERETAVSPDGDWIYTCSNVGTGDTKIIRVRPNGRSAGMLINATGSQSEITVSSGGQALGFINNSNVFVFDIKTGKVRRALPSQADSSNDPRKMGSIQGKSFSHSVLSPKKGWLAAVSENFESKGVYVSVGGEFKTMTLADPGRQPVVAEEVGIAWSPEGSQLALAATGPPGPSYLAVYEPFVPEDTSRMVGIMPLRVLMLAPRNDYAARNPDWGPNGDIAFEMIKTGSDGSRKWIGIVAVDAAGGKPRTLVKGEVHSPMYSPDGKYLLYQKGPDIIRLDLASGESLNLTKGKGINRYPSWSPVLSGK